MVIKSVVLFYLPDLSDQKQMSLTVCEKKRITTVVDCDAGGAVVNTA